MNFKRAYMGESNENSTRVVALTKEQIDIFIDSDTICWALQISDEPWCPDRREGCLVAHGNPLTERVAFFKGITEEQAIELINKVVSDILIPRDPIAFKFAAEPVILNDDWISTIKVNLRNC